MRGTWTKDLSGTDDHDALLRCLHLSVVLRRAVRLLRTVEFGEVPLEGGGVDDDLAALKSKMLGGGEKKGGALPEGRPVSDAIESELEALRKKANDM